MPEPTDRYIIGSVHDMIPTPEALDAQIAAAQEEIKILKDFRKVSVKAAEVRKGSGGAANNTKTL